MVRLVDELSLADTSIDILSEAMPVCVPETSEVIVGIVASDIDIVDCIDWVIFRADVREH